MKEILNLWLRVSSIWLRSDSVEVKIVKGTDIIGGCITEIKCKSTRIIIDFGEELADDEDDFELEGLTYGKPCYNAVFITHSHGDHIGLIDKIMESIPIYVDEKTLDIYNLTCDFHGKEKAKRNVKMFNLSKKGDNSKCVFSNQDIKVIPYIVDHSSYNSCMYLIEGDKKRILHTGDFRNHGRKEYLFDKVLKKIGKIDLLITEGTSLTRCRDKYMTESELEDASLKIMKKYDQIFIMQSSTNVDRTVSFIRSSLRCNKKFVLDLFSYHLNRIINLNIDVDNKNVFVWKPFKYRYKSQWFQDKYLDIKTSSNFFPYFTMEVKMSMLDDTKLLYKKGLIKNACFIYSMWDGYINREYKLQSFIKELGLMNIKFIELHTSGHADTEGMKKINSLVNPEKTIIIHTENKENGKDLFNNVIDINDGIYYKI